MSPAERPAAMKGGPAGGRGRTLPAALGAVLGLLPHLTHHAGFLTGTALVAGLGGTVLFGVIGVVFMVPMLIRLRRWFGTWWAPVIALAIFAAMFTVSTILIGPLLRGHG
jgi:phosphotransferase system  glucose/maltose/N-acetylglucosamine-specific IIC component